MKHVIVGGTFKTGYYFFNCNLQQTSRDDMCIYDTQEEAYDEASWINHRIHTKCLVPLDELEEYLNTDYYEF